MWLLPGLLLLLILLHDHAHAVSSIDTSAANTVVCPRIEQQYSQPLGSGSTGAVGVSDEDISQWVGLRCAELMKAQVSRSSIGRLRAIGKTIRDGPLRKRRQTLDFASH